jgi:hypothetical protein
MHFISDTARKWHLTFITKLDFVNFNGILSALPKDGIPKPDLHIV